MRPTITLAISYSLFYGIIFHLQNLIWTEHFFLPVYKADLVVSFGQMIVAILFMLFLSRNRMSYLSGIIVQLLALCYFSIFFLYKFLHHTPSFYTGYLFTFKGFLLMEAPHVLATLLSINLVRIASTRLASLKQEYWIASAIATLILAGIVHAKSYIYYTDNQFLNIFIPVTSIFLIWLLGFIVSYVRSWVQNFTKLLAIVLVYLSFLIVLTFLAKIFCFQDKTPICIYKYYSMIFIYQGILLSLYILIRHQSILKKLRDNHPIFIL